MKHIFQTKRHKIIFLDLETTGLIQQQESFPVIIEIGARDSETDAEFQIFVNPEGHPISEQSHLIHGLTAEDLKDKTRFSDAWEIFTSWVTRQCKDRIPVIMAYNGKKFDFEVLRHALYKNNLQLSDEWYFTDPFLNLNHVVKPAVLNREDLKLDSLVQKIADFKLPQVHTAQKDCLKLHILYNYFRRNHSHMTLNNEHSFPFSLFNNQEIFQKLSKLRELKRQNKILVVVDQISLSIEDIQFLNKQNIVVVDIYHKFYEFDYLMTDGESLTSAMMIAINTGKPIINKLWLETMKDFQKWVDPLKFPFRNASLQSQYNFNFQNAICQAKLNEVIMNQQNSNQNSNQKGFISKFTHYRFVLTSEKHKDLQMVLESAGAQFVTSKKEANTKQNMMIFVYDQPKDTSVQTSATGSPKSDHNKQPLYLTIDREKVRQSVASQTLLTH